MGIGSQNPRPFGSAQGRLCRTERDKDGAPQWEDGDGEIKVLDLLMILLVLVGQLSYCLG
jgi:hypothetical protein